MQILNFSTVNMTPFYKAWSVFFNKFFFVEVVIPNITICHLTFNNFRKFLKISNFQFQFLELLLIRFWFFLHISLNLVHIMLKILLWTTQISRQKIYFFSIWKIWWKKISLFLYFHWRRRGSFFYDIKKVKTQFFLTFYNAQVVNHTVCNSQNLIFVHMPSVQCGICTLALVTFLKIFEFWKISMYM